MGWPIGFKARVRELARRPVTLALLAILPLLTVQVYGEAVKAFPQLETGGSDPTTLGQMTGALFAVAFLAGLVGLFQVIRSRGGDRRLLIAGYPRAGWVLARALTVGFVVLVSAATSFAALRLGVAPAAPFRAFGVLVLAGALYGSLGVVVGALSGRDLEGSLVLVFLASVDHALATGVVPAGDLAEWAPLAGPHALLEDAVVHGVLARPELVTSTTYLAGGLLLAAIVSWLASGRPQP